MPSFALTSGRKFSTTHVGLFCKALEHREPPSVLQIERHRPLVAVQVLEVRAATRAAEWLAAIFQQGIDLDDIGAPIGELTHAGRSGTDPGQIEHGKTGQGLRGMRDGLQELRYRSGKRRWHNCRNWGLVMRPAACRLGGNAWSAGPATGAGRIAVSAERGAVPCRPEHGLTLS